MKYKSETVGVSFQFLSNQSQFFQITTFVQESGNEADEQHLIRRRKTTAVKVVGNDS